MTPTQEAIQKAMEALEPFAKLVGPLDGPPYGSAVRLLERQPHVTMETFVRYEDAFRARTAYTLLSKCLEAGGAKTREKTPLEILGDPRIGVGMQLNPKTGLMEPWSGNAPTSPQSSAQVPTVEEVARVTEAELRCAAPSWWGHDANLADAIAHFRGEKTLVEANDIIETLSQNVAEKVIALFHPEGEKK